MPCPKSKSTYEIILKFFILKIRCARPPHEHIKLIQYLNDKCMPPVRRQKYAATVQESVERTFTMSAWIDKYRKHP
jgi:hypothetical protein